jgi:YihY family inner membrane protein
MANQGLLLAGAVAYYALLSLVPLLLLALIVLSHVVEGALLFDTLERYLGWLLPGQGKPVVAELAAFVQYRDVMGWVLLGTMIFFSSLAFTVLENAMSIIFYHRVVERRRHFLVSVLLPYGYVVALSIGLLVVTLVAGGLGALGQHSIDFLGREWSLDPLSRVSLYLLGVAGEVLIITSLYLVLPVGRLRFSHALIGGVVAAGLWEITRHFLVWYFGHLSKVGVVYGSLATAIVVLLSLEVGAALLLLGAQVISEYERLGKPGAHRPPKPMRTKEIRS